MKLRTLQSNGSCSDLSVKRSHALTHTLPCHPLSSKLEQHKNKHHAALNKTCDKDHQFIAKALIEVVNQVSQQSQLIAVHFLRDFYTVTHPFVNSDLPYSSFMLFSILKSGNFPFQPLGLCPYTSQSPTGRDRLPPLPEPSSTECFFLLREFFLPTVLAYRALSDC